MPSPFGRILALAIRGWARSRSGIVEQAVAKRLVSRPSLGGIAARAKFSDEVDANLDHRRPGRLKLGIEIFETGLHLAGLDRRDLLLVQILCPIDPAIASDRLVRVGWPGGFGRWGGLLLVGLEGYDAPLLSVFDNSGAPSL